ncbi:hypothetical protein Q7P35_004013 [Cladosporium inversicolor]
MAILASNTTPCSPLSMLNIIPGANMAEHWCATTVISNATIPLMQECCGSWQEVYNHDDYTWCNIAWPDAKNNSDFTLSFSRCREVNAEERKVARPGVWRCELSAYCSHAGACAEYVPVAHVVGYPGRPAMENHTLMHQTLGTGEFGMYHAMVKHISVDTTVLLDPQTAPAEIDRCLTNMMQQSRPVYIGVPVDMSHLECDASGLQTALPRALSPNDSQIEKEVDQRPEFSKLTGFPTFNTYMGKGCIDGTMHNFGGLYTGAGTYEDVKKALESSDAVFWIGNTNVNTGEFTDQVAEDVTAEFQRYYVKIGTQRFEVKIVHVFNALIGDLKKSPLSRASTPTVIWDPYPMNDPEKESQLTQDYLWPTLGKFFKPDDFVIGETGTSAFGLGCSKLPSGASMYNQTVFGSIGYASVERLIHGKNAAYNKLPDWDYSKLANAFGPEHPSKYYGPIGIPEELDDLLSDNEFGAAKCFQLVELKLGRLDAPLPLRMTTAAVEAFNQRSKQGTSMGA